MKITGFMWVLREIERKGGVWWVMNQKSGVLMGLKGKLGFRWVLMGKVLQWKSLSALATTPSDIF